VNTQQMEIGFSRIGGSDTMVESAKAIALDSPNLRARVLKVIVDKGGATDEEIETVTGLKHQTASARRRELVIRGLVEDSGERRLTTSGRKAIVWKEAA
jgi:hypothetical protein